MNSNKEYKKATTVKENLSLRLKGPNFVFYFFLINGCFTYRHICVPLCAVPTKAEEDTMFCDRSYYSLGASMSLLELKSVLMIELLS